MTLEICKMETQTQGLFSYLMTQEEMNRVSLSEETIVLPTEHPKCLLESVEEQSYQWVYSPERLNRLAVQQPDQWLKGDSYALTQEDTLLSHYILNISDDSIAGTVHLMMDDGIQSIPIGNYYEAQILAKEGSRVIHGQTSLRLEEALEAFDEFLQNFKKMRLYEVQCSKTSIIN